MKTCIIIPARYASTRYPGKPLAELRGASGEAKSLIQRSWEAAMAVPNIARVVVATDDDRIKSAAHGFGADVVMTSTSCKNGTERCADALPGLGDSYDVIVNLQGDAPLTPAWFVTDLVAGLIADDDAVISTPVLQTSPDALAALKADRMAGRVGGTTAVFDNTHRALYFSKEVIPYTGDLTGEADVTPVYHHVGVYAYRPEALAAYMRWQEGKLEKLEGLEQLRFLENGAHVKCVEVPGKGREFWELNNPEDVPRIERILKELNID